MLYISLARWKKIRSPWLLEINMLFFHLSWKVYLASHLPLNPRKHIITALLAKRHAPENSTGKRASPSRFALSRYTYNPRGRLYDLDNCTMIKFTVLRKLIRIDDGMRSFLPLTTFSSASAYTYKRNNSS